MFIYINPAVYLNQPVLFPPADLSCWPLCVVLSADAVQTTTTKSPISSHNLLYAIHGKVTALDISPGSLQFNNI